MSAAAIWRRERLALGSGAFVLPLKIRAESFAAQEFHGEKGDFAMHADIENAAHVRVGDSAGELHLLAESDDRPGVSHVWEPEGLERDAFPEAEILGFINFAHAALPKEADNAISIAQNVVGSEGIGGVSRGVVWSNLSVLSKAAEAVQLRRG